MKKRKGYLQFREFVDDVFDGGFVAFATATTAGVAG